MFNTKTPHSVNTFLVDGQVAGTWHQQGKRVVIEPFRKLTRDARSDLKQEAERLEEHRLGRRGWPTGKTR